jgi:hypothetical protein
MIRRRNKPKTEDVRGLANVAHDSHPGELVVLGQNDLVELHRPEIMNNVRLRSFPFAIAEVLSGHRALNKGTSGTALAVLAFGHLLNHVRQILSEIGDAGNDQSF